MQKRTEQELARDLYLHTLKTQQEIADILDVNRRTVYMWIKNGKWEEMKKAAAQAPAVIMQDMFNHITEINNKIYSRDAGDRCPTMEEVEKLRKLVNITNVIHKRHSTGSYVQAFTELMMFAIKNNRADGEIIMRYANDYIRGSIGDINFDLEKEEQGNVSRVRDNLKKLDEELTAEEQAIAKEDEIIDTPACDNDGSLESPALGSDNTSESIPAQPHAENDNTTQTPISGFSDNVISHPSEEIPYDDEASERIRHILNLPPEQRPSPYKDGNIIWVNELDDVELWLDNFGELWGELKMGDIIRRYPKHPSPQTAGKTLLLFLGGVPRKGEVVE